MATWIAVAKDHLDLAVDGGKHGQGATDEAGITAIVGELRGLAPPLVARAATGG